MAEKKIWVAFRNKGVLPKALMGTEKDINVGPHEPVRVPETYGNHLIADRFAYAADELAKQRAAARKGTAKSIAAAEKAVADAKETLDKAGDDLAAKADAEKALAAAEAALAALQDN
ncbi:hypothetical protein HDIA_1985 [Hartmannibacter diazotrophicus]|uniref:Uncharacterized protein n=1 Tax=Hartmannibacter diazotrophicus TaxID=1482074 RepID=A0A2C9D5F9_9HYPH|nr:hypothetical protein [Hartmannibacter diazotrophicus]SON55526.1 hypothetical protein HDIA_1985 [Hartmannibacter diazotrophicus]